MDIKNSVNIILDNARIHAANIIKQHFNNLIYNVPTVQKQILLKWHFFKIKKYVEK